MRPGGGNLIVMKMPDGTEMPNRGTSTWRWFPNEKLVFTDAYGADWQPKDGAPFMTVILTFEDAGPGRTRYTARVRHWSLADPREACEAMGFHAGWGQCADQLAALAATLPKRA